MDQMKENPVSPKTLPSRYVQVESPSPSPDSDILLKARKQGEARARFWNMLVDVVPISGFIPPQDRPTAILHVGCGRAQEADVLTAYFGGGYFGSNSNGATLIGVDIHADSINNAISFNSLPQPGFPTAYKLPDNLVFVCGDATDLSKIKEIPDDVDVVMVRHQQISDREDTWKKIFTQAAGRLRDSGVMILTSFSDAEHRMLERAINELGLRIVVNRANQWGEELQPGGAVSDKRVLVVKKA